MAAEKGPRLLLVDGDAESISPTVLELERAGFRAKSVSTSAEAAEILFESGGKSRRPDLAVIEWTVPGAQELVRELDLPCLVISSRPSGIDAVIALESGACDYVAKPLDPPVFLARVRAILRRSGVVTEPTAVVAGELSVDLKTKTVHCASRRIELSRSEFAVLEALLAMRGRVMSRRSLIDQVIGSEAGVTSRVIDTHVFTLRRKLGACGKRVHTVRGVGYRLD